jgi:histidine phosphotransferase ChpT
MPAILDLKVLELISARMCHDLISPISAIGNGVELITEFEDEMQGEALALIGESGASASHLLQYFRAAFGTARATDGSPLGLHEARARAIDCFGTGRIHFDWPEPTVTDHERVSQLGIKLLMNMVMAAVDILPGSGDVEVRISPQESGFQAEVSAVRDGFTLTEALRQALQGTASTADLTPRSVIGYFCSILAAQTDGLAVSEEAGRVTLQASLSGR